MDIQPQLLDGLKYTYFFPSTVWSGILNSNYTHQILNQVDEYIKKSKKSVNRSSCGGDQYDYWRSEEFKNIIINTIPTTNEPLGNIRVVSWINVNRKGNYNRRHIHVATNNTAFLCGAFYAKVPKNSGVIRFYDPRGPVLKEFACEKYYYGDFESYCIIPEDNMILFFPPWLEHDVEPSESDEERISIGFNIYRGEDESKMVWE